MELRLEGQDAALEENEAAAELCRVLARRDPLALAAHLTGLENRRMKREQLLAMNADELTDTVFEIAKHTYEAKEAAYTPKIMRELERVVMLRVVDEYWMDNIDAMDDLKQGIGLRAYGQHDPVVAYKEEGYQMFEAMITAIKEETIRRMFLVQLRPAQEVKREKVAKETGTSAPDKSQVKRAPVRKEHKVGPNDPCPCGSGKKYKKCCMQKDKLES